MANQFHVEIVRQGSKAIQAWREQNPDGVLDLSGADLSNAQLEGVNLTDANLSGANLCGAQLEWADLYRHRDHQNTGRIVCVHNSRYYRAKIST